METGPQVDYLAEVKQAIIEAPDSIERELAKGMGTWFDCFNTSATYVLAYYELAKARADLSGAPAETWDQNVQVLKDEIERIITRADKKGERADVAGEGERVKFMNMLNIFREPDLPQELA